MTTELMGDPTQEVPCPRCNASVFVSVPAGRVVNFPDISFVMLMHPRIEICPACRAPISCGIAKIHADGIELKWVDLATPQQSKIAVPTPAETAAVNSKLVRP